MPVTRPSSSIFRAIVLGLSALVLPLCMAEDDVAEVLEALNAKVEASPRDAQLYLQRSRLLVTAKRFDQALADLDQANRLKPIPALDREKAGIYLSAGWYETGLEHLSRFLAQNENDAAGLLLRARLNAKLGRLDDAGRDYEAAIRQTKEPGLELYLEHARAVTTEDGAHLDEALKTVEQGIKRIGPVVTLESAALEIELRQRNYDAALSRVD